MTEPRKFPHHLVREIFEQPDALRRTIEPRVSLTEGRVHLDNIRISRDELRSLRRINSPPFPSTSTMPASSNTAIP
jgi:glucosamine 6-phosphate synthetase-like amidotransferase/phosphosugar isomerase protein